MTKVHKKRISISPDRDMESSLLRTARRDGIHVTTKATELVRLGLELEEDIALTAMANHRTAQTTKYIPHERAWK